MSGLKLPPSLSAKFKGTFAYDTFMDRWPVILTKVVDVTHRQRHEITAMYKESGAEDVKLVVSQLSELRYRLSTDKELTPINSKRSDVQLWNTSLNDQTRETGQAPSWFKSPWLYVECYLYRKIAEAFESSLHLHDWDPFQYQKEQSFVNCLKDITVLGTYLVELLEKGLGDQQKEDLLLKLLQISLWGNQYDLSISVGEQVSQKDHSPIDRVETLKDYILVNNLSQVYSVLNNPQNGRVDIIMDNAGMELFSDLCLAEFLVTTELATRVVFHVKPMPWFVSDTTIHDFSWTLEMLRSSKDHSLNVLGHKWHKRCEEGSFEVKTNDFWTLPHPYCEMEQTCPDLYSDLSGSKLLIFKGDLNYRRLTSDLNWPHTETFERALRGFKPAPLLALRTLKADLVVGLKEGEAERLTEKYGGIKWMVTGELSYSATNDRLFEL